MTPLGTKQKIQECLLKEALSPFLVLLRTTCLCRTQNTYGTLKRRYQVSLQEKKNHNQNFSEFSETEAINLKKVASFFQDAIHFHPGHLQPKTLIFTIRALVE